MPPPPACGRKIAAPTVPRCCAAHHIEALEYLTTALANDASWCVRAWVNDGATTEEAIARTRRFLLHHVAGMVDAVELGIDWATTTIEAEL
jgi:hypothetical protein